MLSRRRRNLQKIPLKVTIVITQNQSMDHLEDYQERHIDSIGKVNFAVTKVLLESLNASSIYNRVNTWGYLNQSTGNWTGMMEELVNGRSDIGGNYYAQFTFSKWQKLCFQVHHYFFKLIEYH